MCCGLWSLCLCMYKYLLYPESNRLTFKHSKFKSFKQCHFNCILLVFLFLTQTPQVAGFG